jgi:hypothetical protein
MQTPPDIYWHLTATGWTAIGSIVGAVSIFALTIFNICYLSAARRQAEASEAQAKASEAQAGSAESSLKLLKEQLALTQRPFVAVHSEYREEFGMVVVYAHNQGNGPALDVQALLTFEKPSSRSQYAIGSMSVDQKFHFKIGGESERLCAVVFSYKSISGEEWTTNVVTLAAHPLATSVTAGMAKEFSRVEHMK